MRTVSIALLLVACATPLAAQADRATTLADWQRTRDNVLAYLDAMPESGLGYRPTPGVRSFAEQMDHIVASNIDVAAMAIKGLAQSPVLGDSATYLHSRAALHTYVAATFDYVIGAIRAATPAQLSRRSSMYRQPEATSLRWLQLAMEHSVWTLGQVVPYLRLNHATPPAYNMPF